MTFGSRSVPRERPLVIAHRGASAHAADNTVEAVHLAAEQGADGVEVDVRATRDGIVVLCHADRLPGIGPIIETSFDDLCLQHPRIATLDRVVTVLGRMILNVEIKNHPGDSDYDPTHAMATTIAEWLARYHLEERSLVTSFNPETARAVRRANPQLDTGLLLEHGIGLAEHIEVAVEDGHGWILPRSGTLQLLRGRKMIRSAHDAGLRIATWTVDNPRTFRRLRDLGIDAVITNDPAGALAVYS